ncbi:hypothetical protein DFJ73DRAFT_777286 [Zopfochytrium polystomum]|nr:hypothetical protein DFJ73DRAFT_777286 [Zopfochytrium polystomum]
MEPLVTIYNHLVAKNVDRDSAAHIVDLLFDGEIHQLDTPRGWDARLQSLGQHQQTQTQPQPREQRQARAKPLANVNDYIDDRDDGSNYSSNNYNNKYISNNKNKRATIMTTSTGGTGRPLRPATLESQLSGLNPTRPEPAWTVTSRGMDSIINLAVKEATEHHAPSPAAVFALENTAGVVELLQKLPQDLSFDGTLAYPAFLSFAKGDANNDLIKEIQRKRQELAVSNGQSDDYVKSRQCKLQCKLAIETAKPLIALSTKLPLLQ